jgi:hypothetical protein
VQEQFPWHRLLGRMLTDFFAGSPFHVEAERDLSFKAQLLDILIVRKDAEGVVPPLPDGLRDALAAHNLISFKSFRDTLNDLTLKELTGHYINYRKQVSPSMNDLLLEEDGLNTLMGPHRCVNIAIHCRIIVCDVKSAACHPARVGRLYRSASTTPQRPQYRNPASGHANGVQIAEGGTLLHKPKTAKDDVIPKPDD